MGLLNRNSTITLVSVVGVVTVLIAIFALSLDGIYDHDSHLFEFGPSEQLIFIGITIETWWKYVLLVFFMLTLEFLEILQEEYVHPSFTWSTMPIARKTRRRCYRTRGATFTLSTIYLWHPVDYDKLFE